MNRVEEELRKGKFVCSECPHCKKLVWPPSEFCSVCFNQVRWRQVSTIAKLVEFSKKDNTVFCIAEFEDSIRVMGSLDTTDELNVGQKIRLERCSYNTRAKFVFTVA